MTGAGQRWWERWPTLTALVLIGIVPLLYPAIPPLTDLPGHMGRWHISMAIGHSPFLQRYYAFHWQLIGNLGMDLTVPPIAALIGIEPATKLVVILIPLLTMIGLLWSAREAHGRVPPSAAMALPLAYAWPLQFGFVNYELSQALAFVAFGLWLRLGRQGRMTTRAVCFVPIEFILWITHDFGWGFFGLIAFGAEAARCRQSGDEWGRALGLSILHCLPLALPVVLMVVGPKMSHHGLGAADFFHTEAKANAILALFNDRGSWWDMLFLGPPCALLYVAARERTLGFSALIGWPALLSLAAFVFLPRLLLGGAYVDMRLAPAVLMLALLAIRPPPIDALRFGRAIALAGIAFFGIRIALQTASFASRASAQQAELGAIDAMPRGAAVLALVNRPCNAKFGSQVYDHLPGLAVVRRDAFVNEQWDLSGQQLLSVRYDIAAPYLSDPSQLVYPPDCPHMGSYPATAVAGFNRRAFTHVWTIGFPPGAIHVPSLALLWTNGRSALYRVMPAPQVTTPR